MQFSQKWLVWAVSLVVVLAPATFSTASNGLETVMFSGQPAPGTPDLTYNNPLDQFVLNDQGQVAFNAGIEGAGAGIWLHDPSQTTLIARSGMAAPGGTTSFGPLNGNLALNNLGQVAFTEEPSGPAVWSNASGALELVARRGHPLPGNNYAIWGMRQLTLGDNGKVSFFADTTGSPGSVMSVWTGNSQAIKLVARSEAQAPGAPSGSLFQSRTGFSLKSNDAGKLIIGANIMSAAGLWTASDGDLSLVMLSGSPAPASLPQTTISFQNGLPSTPNKHGQIVLPVGLTGAAVNPGNSAALLFENGGVTSLLAQKGNSAPGTAAGTTFNSFGPLVDLNDSGQIAFRASLIGAGVMPQTSEGLWAGSSDNLQLIARIGDAAPGFDSGVTFSSLTPESSSTLKFFTLNNLGQVAFQARVAGPGISADNDMGIWATGLDGTLRLIARESDSIEVAPGDSRIITALPVRPQGMTGVSPSFYLNDRGQIAFQATFRTGRGIFLSNAVAVPEPLAASLIATALAAAVYSRRRAA